VSEVARYRLHAIACNLHFRQTLALDEILAIVAIGGSCERHEGRIVAVDAFLRSRSALGRALPESYDALFTPEVHSNRSPGHHGPGQCRIVSSSGS
jgi:hypothetical protein